jgi:hypothetical protein
MSLLSTEILTIIDSSAATEKPTIIDPRSTRKYNSVTGPIIVGIRVKNVLLHCGNQIKECLTAALRGQ